MPVAITLKKVSFSLPKVPGACYNRRLRVLELVKKGYNNE